MRFTENGPAIPDLLLQRRDAGRVVFFCGAGVSINAGMPTFLGLAEHVVEVLDPPEDSDVAKALRPWLDKEPDAAVSLDQIFQLLQREYGRDVVNEVVTERLSRTTATAPAPPEHRSILRVSANRDGEPQIVTTNFDLLFEKAHGNDISRTNVPPELPDLSLGMPITGITYLHGKLTDDPEHQCPYVLSSADFGRAYLAEGWATNFVRNLLSRYTVVLLGYRAEDPPVRYLLQGLDHDERSDRSNLYAFDEGAPKDIELKWRDRGVTPLAYADHATLWQTMAEWAGRVDDPRKWRKTVVSLARNNPKTLKPYQRGQVAHLVRTTQGAKQFSKADPTPHPEWVCVFGAGTRAAKPSKDSGEDAETFTPLDAYGLDDDPPLETTDESKVKPAHENLLEWNTNDTNPTEAHRIGGRQFDGYEAIPPRLLALIYWIAKNLNSPAMAWWAARQSGLHPKLTHTLRWQLEREKNLNPQARHVWNLILEAQSHRHGLAWDDRWYDLKARIKKEGWTAAVLREYADITKPKINLSPIFGIGMSRPPSESWDHVRLRQIMNAEVKFLDRHGEHIDAPRSVLAQVVLTEQANFLEASGLLADLDAPYFRTPMCYPDREVEGQEFSYDLEPEIGEFLSLFERLTDHAPDLAAAIASTWPIDDPFLFKSLKLFALNHGKLFSIDQAFVEIQALDEQGFWDSNSVRELLFLLTDRWTEFTDLQKIAVSDRILAGPPKPEHLSEEDYPDRRNELAARYGRWLTLQGCELPRGSADILSAIIAEIPDWSDELATGIVTHYGGRSGRVITDDSPDAIADFPIDEIVERAKEASGRDFSSFTNKRPIVGLAKANLRKTLSALSIAARRGDYPTEFWSDLIQEWPDDASDRLFKVFMRRLAFLPLEAVRKLGYSLSSWLGDKLPALLARDKDLTWRVFDHCVSAWTADEKATESGISEARIGEHVEKRSTRTLGHAINAPVGRTVEVIVRCLDELKLDAAQGIPTEFRSRLERLMDAPGEGRDHAVSVLAPYTSWLHRIDPDWASVRLLPLFDFDHRDAEPAWNGLLHSNQVPPSEIRTAFKELLIDLFPRIHDYAWDRDLAKVGAHWLMWMAVFRRDAPDGLTAKEARACLRKTNDDTRREVVFWLGRVGQKNDDGWKTLVIPFIGTVWPRERAFRTSASVSSWISMLDNTGDDFPAVYAAVKKFLDSAATDQHQLYRFRRDTDDESCLTSRFPQEVLDLMNTIIPDSTESLPYGLDQILQLIEEADDTLAGDSRYNRLLDLLESS